MSEVVSYICSSSLPREPVALPREPALPREHMQLAQADLAERYERLLWARGYHYAYVASDVVMLIIRTR